MTLPRRKPRMKPTMKTSREIAADLSSLIGFGKETQSSLAAHYGVSKAYMCDFLHGRREAGPLILRALGYEITPHYRRIAISLITELPPKTRRRK